MFDDREFIYFFLRDGFKDNIFVDVINLEIFFIFFWMGMIFKLNLSVLVRDSV